MSPTTQCSISDHGAKIAAGHLGITVAEYRRHEAAGEHRCRACKLWLPRQAFYVHNSGTRGLDDLCKPHRAVQTRLTRRRRSQRADGVSYAGPAFERTRVSLTPEVLAVATRDGSAPTCAQNATASTPGHRSCPASLGCREGRIPEGWVRASEAAPCQS